MTSASFTPLRLADLNLANRIVVSPVSHLRSAGRRAGAVLWLTAHPRATA